MKTDINFETADSVREQSNKRRIEYPIELCNEIIPMINKEIDSAVSVGKFFGTLRLTGSQYSAFIDYIVPKLKDAGYRVFANSRAYVNDWAVYFAWYPPEANAVVYDGFGSEV